VPAETQPGGLLESAGVTPTTAIPVYEFGVNLDVRCIPRTYQGANHDRGNRIEEAGAAAGRTRNRIALEVKTALAELESAKSEVELQISASTLRSRKLRKHATGSKPESRTTLK